MIISPVIKNCQPDFSEEDRKMMKDMFQNMERKTIYIAFSEKKFPRSLGQNARYWKILTLIADHIGDDAEALHKAMKDMFMPKFFKLDEDGREVELPKSTTRLTTKEFTEYTDRIEVWASTFHNFTIPEND